jgi:hypothetical protein
MARFAAVLARALLLVGIVARRSDAQEIQITGPLTGACIARLDRYSVPATGEWSTWMSAGATGRAGLDVDGVRHVGGVVGIGAELTTGVFRYIGFPAPPLHLRRRKRPPDSWHSRAYAEVRIGPWGQGLTRSDGAVVEGGLTAHLGTVDDDVRTLVFAAPYGMFDLRIAGGYGAFPRGRSPHVAVAIGWGYRVAPDRQSWGGACDPPPSPASVADAALARVVSTFRQPTDFPGWEAVIALEVSATWFTVPSRMTNRHYRPSD